ncbi:MAG: hypothetical protein KDD43_12730, partial [Bdellovibrionales bacterium]|nr:hypothetical protein [Bdellovibrionales bacterium]
MVSTECGLIVGAGVDEVKRLGPQFHFFNPRGNQHHVVVGEQSASAGSALVVPNTSSSGVAHVPALPEYLPQSTCGDDPFLVMDPETGAMIMNTATLNSIALRFFHERDLGRVLDVNSDSAQFFGVSFKVVFPVVSEVEKGRRRLTLLVWDHGTDEILEVYREPTNNGRSPTVKTVANRFLAIASEDYEYNKAEGHFAFYDFQRGVTLHLTTPQARHGNLKISKDGSQVVWSDWQEGVKRIFTNQAYSIEDQWPKHSSDVQSRK